MSLWCITLFIFVDVMILSIRYEFDFSPVLLKAQNIAEFLIIVVAFKNTDLFPIVIVSVYFFPVPHRTWGCRGCHISTSVCIWNSSVLIHAFHTYLRIFSTNKENRILWLTWLGLVHVASTIVQLN